MIPLQDDNPTRTFPIATILLIAANVLVFLYELALGSQTDQFIQSCAGSVGATSRMAATAAIAMRCMVWLRLFLRLAAARRAARLFEPPLNEAAVHFFSAAG